MDVKGRRHADETRDLGGRQVILEAQCQQEAVRRGKLLEFSGEPGRSLAANQVLVGGDLARIGQQVDIDVGTKRIGQLPAHAPQRRRLFRVARGTTAAIPGPMVVEAEAAGGDGEPRRECRAALRLEDAEPVVVTLVQLFEDIGIPVHRLIPIAAELPCHREKQAAMARDKILPRRVAVRRIGRVENDIELERRGPDQGGATSKGRNVEATARPKVR